MRCVFPPLQIVTVKSQVAREMFQRIAQRRSWSPGEEFSIDGKDFEKEVDINVEINKRMLLKWEVIFLIKTQYHTFFHQKFLDGSITQTSPNPQILVDLWRATMLQLRAFCWVLASLRNSCIALLL